MSPEQFLNPYTFVRTPDRVDLPEDFQDRAPASRAVVPPRAYTGRITVRMEALTPWLLNDLNRTSSDGHSPTRLSTRRGPDGKPLLLGSSVKGMLRSAYEAVTNSRFGVFPTIEDRSTTDRSPRAHDRPKTLRTSVDYNNRTNTKFFAAMSTGKGSAVISRPVLIPFRLLQEHGLIDQRGHPVPAMLAPGSHTTRHRFFADVIETTGTVYKAVQLYAEDPGRPSRNDSFLVEGWIRCMGRTVGTKQLPGQGSGAKQGNDVMVATRLVDTTRHEPDEDFFPDNPEAMGNNRLFPLSAEVLQRWGAVMDDYALNDRNHVDTACVLPAYADPAITRDPSTREGWRSFAAGHIAYATLDRNQDRRITALQPAQVGRRATPSPPVDLLDDSHLPPRAPEQFSSADRVFGNVVHESPERTHATAGRVRIGPPVCLSARKKALQGFPSEKPVEQAVLNSPKPSQYQFYTGDLHQQPWNSGKDTSHRLDVEQRAFDTQKSRLRGRKVYLTHRDVLKDADGARDYWDAQNQDPVELPQSGNRPRHKEYLNHRQDTPVSVRSTLNDWVRPGAVFEVHIDVDALTPLELGALLWLLNNPDDQIMHQIGAGKPLGFGAAKVRVDWKQTTLRTTEALTHRWRSLAPQNDPEAAPLDQDQLTREATDRFLTAINSVPALGHAVQDWSAAARGTPGAPVHYPRLGTETGAATGPAEGKIYEWFVGNSKKDHPAYLPPPGGTLPYLSRSNKNRHNGGHTRGGRQQGRR